MRLIAAGMRNQEIADRLFIGLPTVKRQIANAYGKLVELYLTSPTYGSTRLSPVMRSRPRSKLTNSGTLRASAIATWRQSAKERVVIV
jgi:hypothetical protein